MIYTHRFTEVHAPGGEIYPAAQTVGAHNTAWLLMSNYQRIVFLVSVGTISQGGTVDFLVQQASDATGTGVKAVAGKAITQLTQAGGDGDDLVAVEVRTEELDVDGSFEYVRGVLTIGVDTALVAVLPQRHVANYPPVPTTGYTEIVD